MANTYPSNSVFNPFLPPYHPSLQFQPPGQLGGLFKSPHPPPPPPTPQSTHPLFDFRPTDQKIPELIKKNIAFTIRLFFLDNHNTYWLKNQDPNKTYTYICNPMEHNYIDQHNYKQFMHLAFPNKPYSSELDIFKYSTQMQNGLERRIISVNSGDFAYFIAPSPSFATTAPTIPLDKKRRQYVKKSPGVQVSAPPLPQQSSSSPICVDSSSSSSSNISVISDSTDSIKSATDLNVLQILQKEEDADIRKEAYLAEFVDQCVFSSTDSEHLVHNISNLRMIYIIYMAWNLEMGNTARLSLKDFSRSFVKILLEKKDDFPIFREHNVSHTRGRKRKSTLENKRFKGILISFMDTRYPERLWDALTPPPELLRPTCPKYEAKKKSNDIEYIKNTMNRRKRKTDEEEEEAFNLSDEEEEKDTSHT